MDFRPFAAVDNALPRLSHAIYVERSSTGLHGFVVLFGHIRMYCKLGPGITTKEPCAILGLLDVTTGKEHFSQLEPQGLTEAPFLHSTKNLDQGLRGWTAEMQRQVSEAGAKGWLCSGELRRSPCLTFWKSSTADVSYSSWGGNTLAPSVLAAHPKKN